MEKKMGNLVRSLASFIIYLSLYMELGEIR